MLISRSWESAVTVVLLTRTSAGIPCTLSSLSFTPFNAQPLQALNHFTHYICYRDSDNDSLLAC